MAKYVPTKHKSTSIWLSILFGNFTYLYTYKYESWKFWLTLILNLTLFWTLLVPLMIWIISIIDSCMKPKELFRDYYR